MFEDQKEEVKALEEQSLGGEDLDERLKEVLGVRELEEQSLGGEDLDERLKEGLRIFGDLVERLKVEMAAVE